MYQYWQAVAPRSMMRWVSEVIIEMLDVAECVVLTRRDAGYVARRAVGGIRSEEISERTLKLMDIAMQTSILISPGRIVAVESLNSPLAFPHVDLMRDAGFHAYMSIPFSIETDLDGVICIADVKPRQWTASDKQFIQDVSSVVARSRHLDREVDLNRGELSTSLSAPLASIVGHVRIVLDGAVGALNASQEQMLRTVERSAMQLLATIDDPIL